MIVKEKTKYDILKIKTEFADFFTLNGFGDVIIDDYSILNTDKIDLFIPSKNIGFDFNGFYWNDSEEKWDKGYCFHKSKLCIEKNVRLIHLFDDEIYANKNAMKAQMLYLLEIGKRKKPTSYSIKEISSTTKDIFLNENSFLPITRSSFCAGIFENDKLFGIMSVLIHVRYPHKCTINCFFVLSEYDREYIAKLLLDYTLENTPFNTICWNFERRFSLYGEERFFKKLGFKQTDIHGPNCYYYFTKRPYHRIYESKFRTLLRKNNFSEIAQPYKKGWDCGIIGYTYNRCISNNSLDESKICETYKQENFGIEQIAKQYHVAKSKIKAVLIKNGVKLKNRGGQSLNRNYVIENPRIAKYHKREGFHYEITDPNNPIFKSKDVLNRSGALTSYIEKRYGIETPPVFFRDQHYMITGNYWWEQWLKCEEVPDKETKKCPYCNWETTDLRNLSGAFAVHLQKKHNKTIFDYIRDFPKEESYFSNSKTLNNIDFETDENKFVFCKICGKKLSYINGTHLKRHNITKHEYIERFGNDGIVCNMLHYRFSRLTTERNTNAKPSFVSKGEKELRKYIEKFGLECEHTRSAARGREIDIYIPSKNIGIEYNGLYWHCDLFKTKREHLEKTLACEKLGIRLIQLFEDEWVFHEVKVKMIIRRLLGIFERNVNVENCIIKLISTTEAKNFIKDYSLFHFQKGSINVGLYLGTELLSLISFSARRGFYNGLFQLFQIVHKADVLIENAEKTMFKFFLDKFNPHLVIAFADRRWDDGVVYESIGFKREGDEAPSVTYFNNIKRYTTEEMVKKALKSSKMMDLNAYFKQHGYHKIYDCGYIKYVYLCK